MIYVKMMNTLPDLGSVSSLRCLDGPAVDGWEVARAHRGTQG